MQSEKPSSSVKIKLRVTAASEGLTSQIYHQSSFWSFFSSHLRTYDKPSYTLPFPRRPPGGVLNRYFAVVFVCSLEVKGLGNVTARKDDERTVRM